MSARTPMNGNDPLRHGPRAAWALALSTLLALGVAVAADPPSDAKPDEVLTFGDSGKEIAKPSGTTGNPEPEPGVVLAVAFSPDGKTLALAGQNPSVVLREVTTNKTIAVLAAHTAPVACLAFSPDGKTLATGGYDHSAKLWDVAKGSETTTLLGHEEKVNALAFSPDGKTLATAGQEGNVKLWGVADGKELATLDGGSAVHALAFAPDGKTLATAGSGRVIRIWDVATRSKKGAWSGHAGTIRALVFSPDGKTLVSGGEDHQVLLWDVEKGKPRATLEKQTDQVLALAYSAGGRGLAVAGHDASAKVWDVSGASPVLLDSLDGQAEGITALAFNPNGGALVTASFDRTVKLRTPAPSAGRFRLTLAMDSPPYNGCRPFYSADGSTYAIFDSGMAVRFWDTKTWTESGSIATGASNAVQLQFSDDGGRMLVTSGDGDDKKLTLWDVKKRALITEIDGSDQVYPRAALSPDGKSIAMEGKGASVVIRDVDSGGVRPLIPGQSEAINGLTYSPGGKILAQILISADLANATVRTFEVESGKAIGSTSLPNQTIHRFRFSPDGSSILAVVSQFNSTEGQRMIVWTPNFRREVARVELNGTVPGTFTVSRDGRWFAMANPQGLATLYDLPTRKPQATLKTGLPTSIQALSLAPDGKTLVALGTNESNVIEAKVWDLDLKSPAAAGNATKKAASKK